MGRGEAAVEGDVEPAVGALDEAFGKHLGHGVVHHGLEALPPGRGLGGGRASGSQALEGGLELLPLGRVRARPGRSPSASPGG
jgi:hypothetical protein